MRYLLEFPDTIQSSGLDCENPEKQIKKDTKIGQTQPKIHLIPQYLRGHPEKGTFVITSRCDSTKEGKFVSLWRILQTITPSQNIWSTSSSQKMKKRSEKNQRANPLIFLSDPSVSLSYSLTNVEERKRVKANSADEASQVEKAVKAIDDRRLVKGFKGVE